MRHQTYSAIDIFVNKDRQAWFWLCLFLFSIAFFSFERSRIIRSLKTEQQFVVLDGNTFYLPKSVDFESAKDVHVAQVALAMESLFDRNPNGVDNPKRLARLFDRQSHSKVLQLVQSESDQFQSKEIHQKVEIAGTDILETSEETVLASATGQLIRSGIFAGNQFTEVLDVRATFTFIHNKDILSNGAFPTVVVEFAFEATPKKAS
tara:strand:+ start:97 stop:714 length:618 start_codon:yes stop_codon:yes gene_type:complete